MATATKNIYAEKIQGNLSITSVSATSISATTYYNLPSSTATTIYNGDGILSGNRIVNLSSYTLNFSSSTNPNTLVMSGGSVGIGVSTPESKLQVSGVTTITGQWNTGSTVNGLHFSFGHPVTGPNIGQIYSIQNGVSWRRLDVEGDPLILNGQSGGNVGIGITSPLTALHVSSVSDPLTLSGVQSTSDDEVLTIDTNGVVHKKPIFLKNRTNSSTETVIAYQSIFNPAKLDVRVGATFTIEAIATYYVLGDLNNSGSIVVDGTLKVGGIIKNNGPITGSGIIE